MLQLSGDLPAGALLGSEAGRLADRLRAGGAVWFSARAGQVRLDGNGAEAPVTEWHSMCGTHIARPSRPNSGNGRFVTGWPSPAMQFRQKLNCGYAVADVAPDARAFTVAVIYSSFARDGRTLVSIGTNEGDNILFLNEADGVLVAKDRSGGIEIECEAPENDNGRALVLMSLEPSRLRLRLGQGPVVETRGSVEGLAGAAELFIGCRNHRSGLQKTLGDLQISDVIFWPSGTVLAAPGMTETDQSAAVSEFWRWTR